MTVYLISDNIDTLTGMRLAGVLGTVVHDREALEQCLEKVRDDRNVGIILITEKVSDMAPDLIRELKQVPELPLLVVIPDRHGSSGGTDSITAYVKETIGI